MKVKRILYWVTVVFLSAVILVCGTLIAQKLIDDARNQDYYESMSSTKPSVSRPPIPDEPIIPTTESTEPAQPTEPGETTAPSTEPTEPGILFDLQMSYAINNDLVGWMEIPGTKINYPVVQSPYEANFYLRRNFKKENATCGTLYVREACDVFRPSDNVTIYGHNMRNGTTLYQRLQELYQKYGYCKEAIINRVIGGIVPMDTMKEKMASLRACPPASFGGSKVTEATDYLCDGTGLPKANMLSYLLENGTTVLIRPSGTEPKIKVYILTQAESESAADEVIAAVKADAENLI